MKKLFKKFLKIGHRNVCKDGSAFEGNQKLDIRQLFTSKMK